MIDVAEQESQKIWEAFRNGEIMYQQVEIALNDIWSFADRKGFFEQLENFIGTMLNKKLSLVSRPDSSILYFEKRENARSQFIVSYGWSNFWLSCEWLEFSQEDLGIIPNLKDYELVDYMIVLSASLHQFVDRELQDSEQAQTLHQIYKALKSEIEKRPQLNELHNKPDSFLDYIENKDFIKQHEEQLSKARVTGSICIHCGSINVRSYNSQEWKCHSCGKRFRKH